MVSLPDVKVCGFICLYIVQRTTMKWPLIACSTKNITTKTGTKCSGNPPHILNRVKKDITSLSLLHRSWVQLQSEQEQKLRVQHFPKVKPAVHIWWCRRKSIPHPPYGNRCYESVFSWCFHLPEKQSTRQQWYCTRPSNQKKQVKQLNPSLNPHFDLGMIMNCL